MKLRLSFLLVLFIITSCKDKVADKYDWHSLTVTVTAYNSLAYQTSADPNITAWGDSLVPGMKCIAVSRDLISRGLKHNTRVKIEGFDGIFLVKDKMNKRWKNRIDIYMDNDVKKAKKWGKRKLRIMYGVIRVKENTPEYNDENSILTTFN
jgi:3D (Asp-Asp-Asp) domain-containing protein